MLHLSSILNSPFGWPPFILTEEAARQETRELIANKLIWVLTSGPDRTVASLVAFTRNSEKVGTIIKAFTIRPIMVEGVWNDCFVLCANSA